MSPYQLVRPKGKGKMKRKREGEEEREKKEGRRGGKGTQWVRESQWRGYALSSAGKESSTCFEGGESPSISARPRLKTTPYLRFALELANNKAHDLLDRTTYVCQHLLIISGDLSAGNQHWQSTLAIVEHGQH